MFGTYWSRHGKILASQTSEKNRKQRKGFTSEHLVLFVLAFEQFVPFDNTDVTVDCADGGTEKGRNRADFEVMKCIKRHGAPS